LEGGASRALVFLNYPTALVAIAVLATLAPSLGPAARGVALVAGLLCAVIFWPGVVTQADLDARPVNAVCAVGVVLAVALSVGRTRPLGRMRGDGLRLAAAAHLLVVSLPREAADGGGTTEVVPGVAPAAVNWGWAVVLAIAVASWALWLRRATARSGASPHLPVPASDTRA